MGRLAPAATAYRERLLAAVALLALAIVWTMYAPLPGLHRPTSGGPLSGFTEEGIEGAPGIWTQASFASMTDFSEQGIGALVPWGNRLYVLTYLSAESAVKDAGLYAIDRNLRTTKLRSHGSCYANRLVHIRSKQLVIGRWVISLNGDVQELSGLSYGNIRTNARLGSSAEHLHFPETMVYMLGMDGVLFECNVVETYQCKVVVNLVKALKIPAGHQPHFKAAHTMDGVLRVASNTFDDRDELLTDATGAGRLGAWNGVDDWEILEHTGFYEIAGRANFGKVVYAVGWDAMSVILRVYAPSFGAKVFRLPKASHAWDHMWETEWPRIREVGTERYMLDAHGMFYELAPLAWQGSIFGIKPVCQHVRVIPDYTVFAGMLVLGSNQVSAIRKDNIITGQSQSGLWFGKVDDLWSFGKPQGWGQVWRRTALEQGNASEPFLMTGFDKKSVHFSASGDCLVCIELDVTGTASRIAPESNPSLENWLPYNPDTDGCFRAPSHSTVFPSGLSAHWVRLVVNEGSCENATATFIYT